MSITLGSNIVSLRMQRQLAQTSDRLSTTFERLSSGQRINRASDDAAGLAIAESLNADTAILNQGMRNIDQALSALTVRESAMRNLLEITNRLSELSQQAANGTYSTEQREALDTEADALVEEFNRIADTTSYNGINLLDGSTEQITAQAGSGAENSIELALGGGFPKRVGSGSFGAETTYPAPMWIRHVEVADFNNDGLMDVMGASSASTNNAVIYLNEGSGTFSVQQTLQGDSFPIGTAAIGDLNNDGELDVLTGSFNGTYLNVFLGNGDATFKARQTQSHGPDSVDAFRLADLNSDGNLDLVFDLNEVTTRRFGVRFGAGDGTFGAIASFGTVGISGTGELGDVNNDGLLDFVQSNGVENSVNVYLGNSNGTFTAATSLDASANLVEIELADVTGDGVLDILGGDVAAGIFMFQGSGGGNFGNVQTVSTTLSPVGLRAVDMNDDGSLDLVSNIPHLAVMFNEGGGTFSAEITSDPANSESGRLNVADFNGDGVPDVAFAHRTLPGLGILFQETTLATDFSLAALDLTTVEGALEAAEIADETRGSLLSELGNVGAQMSRLDFAGGSIRGIVEEMSAASGRILDADIAAEAAEMTRLNILQQAVASVLAQANQQPAIALALLS